jgi:hypothetical protein
MYDHQTESLWLQVKKEAVAGPMTGTELKILPSTLTSWKKWKNRFPKTEVLSIETGHKRDYSRDPYENYYKSRSGLFSFFKDDPGENDKRLVAGITFRGSTKAYPIDILRKKSTLTDHVGDMEITIKFDKTTDSLTIQDTKGRNIPYIAVYWFVWKGIHPDSQLFLSDK